MTLLNIVRQKDRVHLLTDGAGLDDNGLVEGIVSKCVVYPHLNLAMGFRGVHRVGMIVMSSFSSAKSFDDLKLFFAETVKEQVAATKDAWTKMIGPTAMHFDLAVVGWSKKGPAGFFLSTVERLGTPAFQVISTDNLITPSTNDLYTRIAPAFSRPEFNIDDDMVAIAEQQRQIIEPYGPKQIETSLVGGFLQLTTVTKNEISTRVIHRWDDRIGEPINV